jgi:hypothetical protein
MRGCAFANEGNEDVVLATRQLNDADAQTFRQAGMGVLLLSFKTVIVSFFRWIYVFT